MVMDPLPLVRGKSKTYRTTGHGQIPLRLKYRPNPKLVHPHAPHDANASSPVFIDVETVDFNVARD